MAGSGDDVAPVRVSVLGPLLLEVGGRRVDVPGAKRSAVLTMLAMASPHAISVDRLLDALWPDDPPESGRAALQSHVSRLRRHLGNAGSRLVNTTAGYRLELAGDELDATVAERQVAEARRVGSDDPGRAVELLREARSLWRGEPLAGLTEVEPLAAWARSLTETRLAATDLLTQCALACGDSTAAVAAATEAVAADPMREAGAVLLARALAADGRAVEALRATYAFRTRLRDEAGLDASPALAAVEHELLAAEPERVAAGEPARLVVGELIGRERELSGVVRLLASERLVTLVGSGGVGKTHLALAVAERLTGGRAVTVLRLAPVTEPAGIAAALMRTLGLQASAGDPIDHCVLRLRAGPQLLVVDNCEHLLGGVVEVVGRLLVGCPELTILATSRQRLAVPAEQTCPLAPLPMPAVCDGHDVLDVPSVALFLARARRADPNWEVDAGELETVSRVVRRLDGMPLAIELAAGRLSAMSVSDLDARLDRALDLLGLPIGSAHAGSAESRHRTLRAAVEWSYDLLPATEQRLFRHLATCPDGFDLATAEAIAHEVGAGAEPVLVLGHLVDASMVVFERGARYRMLDTLRAFGLDRLEAAGETGEALERFVAWAHDLAERVVQTMWSGDEASADRRMRSELGNLQAAWRLLRDAGDLDRATSIAIRLYEMATWRDTIEVWAWLRELADDPALIEHPAAAAVLGAAADATWFSTGDLDRAGALARRGLELVRPGDAQGEAFCWFGLGDVLLLQGRFEDSETALLRASAVSARPAESLSLAAMAAMYDGRLDRAEELLDETRRQPLTPTLGAFVRHVEGELLRIAGRWEDALAAFDDVLAVASTTGATFLEGIASVSVVSVHAAAGDFDAALRGYGGLIDYWERTGGWTQQWTTLRNLADLLDQLDDQATATMLRAAADAAPEAAGAAGASVPVDGTDGPQLDRVQVIGEARAAIVRHLTVRTG